MEIVHFKASESFWGIVEKIFTEEKGKLLSLIPAADIQHIGSTAIAGAVTKGDLDIQARVPIGDFEEARNRLRELYNVNQFENWSETYASFKDENSKEIPLGIQLTAIDSEEDRLFRKQQEVLLTNPNVLDEYNKLKLSYDGKSIDDYRAARKKFFEGLKKRGLLG